jgi:hypothetical protein
MRRDGEKHRCDLNPGSAGRRRFRLPVTVARLVVEAGEPTAEIIELQVESENVPVPQP